MIGVKYNKLLKLLIDKKMSTAELRDRAGVSANIISKIKQDQYISMESLARICVALDCTADEILEFVKED